MVVVFFKIRYNDGHMYRTVFRSDQLPNLKHLNITLNLQFTNQQGMGYMAC